MRCRHVVEAGNDRLDQRRKLLVGRQIAHPAHRRQHDGRQPHRQVVEFQARRPRRRAGVAKRGDRNLQIGLGGTGTRRRRRISRQAIHNTMTATAAGST